MVPGSQLNGLKPVPMLKKLIAVISFAAAFGVLFPATAAVQVDDLYQARVPVEDQGAGQRAQALQTAMREILTRIAGPFSLGDHPGIAQALKTPARYVVQYRYREERVMDEESEQPREQLLLWAQFEQQAIERLLRDNRLPTWGRQRPATLVWAAVEDGSQRRLLGGDTVSPIRDKLMEQAHRRGIPLLFPLLDLQDQRHLNFADVWAGFADAIREASSRYSAEAVLRVRLSRSQSDRWQARWTLYDQQQEYRWESADTELGPVLKSGVDGTADRLASRYAMKPGERTDAHLTVNVADVNSVRDYARLEHYIGSRAYVKESAVVEVSGSDVRFELVVRGDPEHFVRTLALGNVLVRTEDGQGGDGPILPDTVFNYRLLP